MPITHPQTDGNHTARLADQLRRGEVILVTGAGFSRAAKGVTGQPIPGVDELKRLLWDCAFGDDPYDEQSSLDELYECAVTQAGNETQHVLDGVLRVDADSLPDVYETWFSIPWHRIYTLNVDDLAEVASRKFSLPREIVTLSALREEQCPESALACVHLNGRLADYPEMTFSSRQFGERTAAPDLWYQQFIRDYAVHPVIFVGTTLDEPPLWHHLAMRGRRRGERRELRPGSYLVSPSLSAPRRAILGGYNVDHVAMSQGEFAAQVLAPLGEEAVEGLRALRARSRTAAGAEAFLDVGELRRDVSGDPRDFLWGRGPLWRDLTDGYAVERQFESGLPAEIASSGASVAILTGTAGSGKSTTLMRLALEHHAQGRSVRWLNPDAVLSLSQLRTAARVRDIDVLVVDDADSFGQGTGPLLAQFAADNADLLVLAAIRSTRYGSLELDAHLRDTEHFQLTIPHLEDVDIERFIDALGAANRLGVLTGKPRVEQIAAFKRRASRQLIVAMIETTTNERFDEKIRRECAEIGADAGVVYAVIALATHLRRYVTLDEVLAAVGGKKLEALNIVRDLVNQHLVSQSAGNEMRLRHRVISDKVVEHYRAEQLLAEPVRGLLFALATSVTQQEPRNSRKWRLVTTLFNHDWLIRELVAPVAIRRIYDEVERVMSWDSHYWLQRGSFEVEQGHIEQAKTFLETARSIAPHDYRIQNEWAYMTLKRAAGRASESDAVEAADEAFATLGDAIDKRGRKDPYPFHVMGSQGLAWAKQAPLARDEKLKLLERLRFVVGSGARLHPADQALSQLEKDLEAYYLLVGVASVA